MTVIKDVLKELFSMFVGDAWLTLAVLILVLCIALGVHTTPVSMHLTLGFAMLAGCILIIITVTVRHTQHMKRQTKR